MDKNLFNDIKDNNEDYEYDEEANGYTLDDYDDDWFMTNYNQNEYQKLEQVLFYIADFYTLATSVFKCSGANEEENYRSSVKLINIYDRKVKKLREALINLIIYKDSGKI